MITCNQTLGGIPFECEPSIGGIKEVYIARYDDIDGKPTVTESGDTKGVITEIPITGESKFKGYSFRKNTGSMTSTLTVDETAGINYVSTELSLVFTKMDTQKRIEMSALALGRLAVIVKDSNGKYWYLGYDDYVSATAGGANSGQNKGDQNAYTLTLRDESETFPYEISEQAITGVIS